jgi:diadenosine tetraphosphate (Ap4A) HIT family hydrolase
MTDTLEQAQKDGRAPWTTIQLDTRDFVVFKDGFPVTEGHTLVVPKVNTQQEVLKCFKFALAMGEENVAAANNITGYNIGLNTGESAGQTCMYPHVHLIFRRDGDCTNPKGGIRHCVPGKGDYTRLSSGFTEYAVETLEGC